MFSEEKRANAPFVSVIIPVYNDALRLQKCLEALSGQTYREFETFVIDNGSTEPGLEPLRERFENVIFLREEKPGSYAARNKGLECAKGEIIAFTDADCIPDERWLELGVKKLQETPNCGFVGGHVSLFAENPESPTWAELYELRWAFPQKTFIEKNKFAVTANLLTWRKVIDTVGMFDDTLKSAGDREWGNRVARNGYAIVYDRAAVVNHPARRSLGEIKSKLRRATGGRRDLDKSHRAGIILLLKYLKLPLKQLFQTLSDNQTGLTLGQRLQVCYIIISLRVALAADVIELWWGNAPSARA